MIAAMPAASPSTAVVPRSIVASVDALTGGSRAFSRLSCLCPFPARAACRSCPGWRPTGLARQLLSHLRKRCAGYPPVLGRAQFGAPSDRV